MSGPLDLSICLIIACPYTIYYCGELALKSQFGHIFHSPDKDSLSLSFFLFLSFFSTVSLVTASWDPTCCLKKLNGNIPKRRIVRYTIQTAGPCPFEAIIFQTKCGRKLCYGLNMDKAMEVKNIIDEKRQKAVSSAEQQQRNSCF
uniref:Chemokine interleukin-8-like domain-containing protein n=1 Tax=Electrophorus electricus TaxID=8005 RepID=A0AAY5EHH0_ELEEL